MFGGLLGLAYLVIRLTKKSVNAQVVTPKKYRTLDRLTAKDFPIKKGSKGFEIGLLQEKAGMTPEQQDGIWGSQTEAVISRVFGKNKFTLKEYNDVISSQVFGGKTIFQQAQEQQQNTKNFYDKLNLKF